MLKTLIKKVFGTKQERELKRLRPIVGQVNGLESSIKELSDDELKAKTPEFKQRIENGEPLDDLLPEAFAVVRETAWRRLKMRHYDVQILGGVVLHQGKIAEMKTGEGKTLSATAPMYLNALAGEGAHLVTVNDYLADRDADWMGEVYRFLGMSVGKILSDLSTQQRREAYNSDITYGTNNEFGFDYLRDNMKYKLDDYVQREHAYAIVDEVDSILIDEARTPLIISGQVEQSLELYYEIDKMIPFLKKDEDYTLDEKHNSVSLTEEGIEKIEAHLEIENIYDPRHIEYLHHVNKALAAHTLYKKDQNYVVHENKVVIVDEFTGRLMPGRRWSYGLHQAVGSDGLHQAVEAKEGVPIQNESRTLATITFQNYFRMYEKLAGMTGTADTEAEEFKKTYELDTLVIPTNEPVIRKDHADLIYRSERDKIAAIIDQIEESNAKGQPILVGTVSVEKSEVISKVLRRKGIDHAVLNAKNHALEAEIVAQAGRKGAVTIATNMAGRGTDIMLGGNPEFMARRRTDQELEKAQKRAATVEDEDEKQEILDSVKSYEEWLEHYVEACAKEKQEVLDAGGLFILGTERHESRRIDNQLRGRAGRQGDPGESRFYLSLDDDLMRIFGAERIGGLMDRLGMEPGVPIEHKMVTRAIENAQRRVEGRNFDIRKHLLEYDDVMNAQREAIYSLRHSILKGDNLRELILDMMEDVVIALGSAHMPEGVMPEDWDVDGLLEQLEDICDREINIKEAYLRGGASQRILEEIWKHFEKAYEEKEKEFAEVAEMLNEQHEDDEDWEPRTARKLLGDIEQRFYLREIDSQWRDHLEGMSALRDAIRLRGYGQRDPKQEYKREGYDLFVDMLTRCKANVARQIFRVQVQKPDELPESIDKSAPQVTGITTNRSEDAPSAEQMQAIKSAVKKAIEARAAAAAAASAPDGSVDPVTQDVDEAEEPAEAKPEKQKITTVVRDDPKLGRNDPCWCGSGKKYKQCHYRKDQEQRHQATGR